MASRVYQPVLYVDEAGKKRRVRLDTDVIAAQTTAPGTGAPDVKGTMKVSGSRRGFGVHPRGFRLTRLSGAAGSRLLYDFLVICAHADWVAKDSGDTVTLGGNTWVITSLVSEVIH